MRARSICRKDDPYRKLPAASRCDEAATSKTLIIWMRRYHKDALPLANLQCAASYHDNRSFSKSKLPIDVTAASVSGPGVGYGTGNTPVFAVGGVPIQGTITSGPEYNYLGWFPRPVNIGITGANTSVSTGTAGVVYDGGLFLAAPTAAWPNVVGATGTVGSVAFVMGSRPDIATMQPAP